MKQFILPFAYNAIYHPEEFIVSASNQFAYDALQNWQTNWGVKPYEFALLISGPASSGKTYLAEIWRNMSDGFVLTGENFNEEILLQNNNFIIENIEDWQEETVLYLFNLLSEHHKYLLMTATNVNLKFEVADLSSRIHSVLNLKINAPDDELMKILIFKYFSNYSITISSEILGFLLTNLPRHHAHILSSLQKINDFSLVHKRKVTLQLIKEVL